MKSQSGLLIIVSGPSGVGKTTITHQLVARLDAVFSVSMTTRKPASSDREGVDYYFVDEDRFKEAINREELLEWAKVFDRYYGTPRKPVEQHISDGRDVILEIDVAGGVQVKRIFPQAVSIFVLPPSEAELLNRLRQRGREDEAGIQRRFREAQTEIAAAQSSGAYEHFVVNHTLKEAVDEAASLIEKHRIAAAEPTHVPPRVHP